MERWRKALIYKNGALRAPNTDGNVWPWQSCPAFEEREGAVVGIKECWYCCYADFHLERPCALDVGICCWSKKIWPRKK